MLLSVCIPTHHGRSERLHTALESVCSQLTDDLLEDVQVCVSDNASMDGTADVVETYRERLSEQLVYRRWSTDRGFTENLQAVVEMADGSFCWLLGSDDTVIDGGLQRVVNLIRRHPQASGATLNHLNVDTQGAEDGWLDPPYAMPAEPDRGHVYRWAEVTFWNCAFLQDYISAQVVRRDRFLAAAAALGARALRRARNFPHIYILAHMVRTDPIWLWHPEAVVRKTLGTSSVDRDGEHRFDRYQIMVMRQRSKAWADLFGRGTPLWRSLMYRAYLYGADARSLRYYKSRPNHTLTGDALLLLAFTREFYWLRRFWSRSMPALLVPYPLVEPVRALQARARGTPVEDP